MFLLCLGFVIVCVVGGVVFDCVELILFTAVVCFLGGVEFLRF